MVEDFKCGTKKQSVILFLLLFFFFIRHRNSNLLTLEIVSDRLSLFPPIIIRLKQNFQLNTHPKCHLLMMSGKWAFRHSSFFSSKSLLKIDAITIFNFTSTDFNLHKPNGTFPIAPFCTAVRYE